MDLLEVGTEFSAQPPAHEAARSEADGAGWMSVASILLVVLVAAVTVLWVFVALRFRHVTLALHLAFLTQLLAVSLAAWLVARSRASYVDDLQDLEYAIDAARTHSVTAEHAQALYRDVLSESGIGWYRVTTEGRLVATNNALAKMLGFRSSHHMREHFSVHTFPDGKGRPGVIRALKAVGEIRGHASTWTRADGSALEITETARGLRDGAGRTAVIEGFVTEPVSSAQTAPGESTPHQGSDGSTAALEQLQAAKAKIEILEGALSGGNDETHFVAHMSHELRTPINAIVGMTSLLADTNIDPEQRDFVDTIRISSESLLSIVNNVLDYSKIEADKLRLETRPFELRTCVEEAIDLVSLRASEKRLELVHSIDAAAPEVLIGDSIRVRQILVNLLTNAVKFTHEGEVSVSVSARQLEGARYEYQFAVSDTGIGIPKDRQEELFSPFYQTEASTTREFGGTGLGLSISRLLSREMGGDLNLESVAGQGSTFRFTILSEVAGVRAVDEVRAYLPRLRDKRILVVDDNDASRNMLMRLLESLDTKPRGTGNPAEALDLVRGKEGFDLILVSLSHFGQDPVVFARRVRSFEESSTIPLVLLRSVTQPPIYNLPARTSCLLKPVKRNRAVIALARGLDEKLDHQWDDSNSRIQAADQSLSILVAEDDVINQKVMLRLLERLGHRADVVGSGDPVVETLQHTHYDVVLLDVRMPGMTGPEAAQAVTERFPLASQRPHMIGMTASTAPEEKQKCLDSGMDTCLTKPITIDDLVRELARAESRDHRTSRDEGPSGHEIRSSVRRQLASKSGDEPAFMAELLTSFLRTAPTLLKNLEEQLGKRDLKGIRRSARTLKSSCQFIGLMRLAALCKALEVSAAGKAGEGDLEPFARTIAGEFGRIRPVLAEERKALLRRAQLPNSVN